MKIALAGPSGTGKTTLTRFIESNFKLTFQSNSAQHLFTGDDRTVLQKLGYMGTGHKEVVELSMKNEKFAGEFQRRLLWRRGDFIENNDNFIIDRSPLDNLAYFMYQSSFQATEEFIEEFVKSVNRYIAGLDLIIFIPTTNPGTIENNHSRVANYHFQRMISSMFYHCIHEFSLKDYCRIETIDFWDLSRRKDYVTYLINSLYL